MNINNSGITIAAASAPPCKPAELFDTGRFPAVELEELAYARGDEEKRVTELILTL
jgi:hypothetical protein